MKFVSSLTPAEKITLQEAAKKHPSYRTRQRCEALLLSHKGSTIVQLCEVFGISRNTAGIWINNWETKGFVGLLDGKRDGRPRILSESEEKSLIGYVSENPHQLKAAAAKLERETGKKASYDTYKRALKRGGWCGKGAGGR